MQLKVRLKTEDVDAIVRKKLSIEDLRRGFNEQWNEGLFDPPLYGRPSAGVTPETRRAVFGDYAELFRDAYTKAGDVDLAKDQAINQLKKVWGVTNVTGTATMMRYPPESSPAYVGIPDAAHRIAAQASEAIRVETGQDIPRGKLELFGILGDEVDQAAW